MAVRAAGRAASGGTSRGLWSSPPSNVGGRGRLRPDVGLRLPVAPNMHGPHRDGVEEGRMRTVIGVPKHYGPNGRGRWTMRSLDTRGGGGLRERQTSQTLIQSFPPSICIVIVAVAVIAWSPEYISRIFFVSLPYHAVIYETPGRQPAKQGVDGVQPNDTPKPPLENVPRYRSRCVRTTAGTRNTKRVRKAKRSFATCHMRLSRKQIDTQKHTPPVCTPTGNRLLFDWESGRWSAVEGRNAPFDRGVVVGWPVRHTTGCPTNYFSGVLGQMHAPHDHPKDST